MVTATMFEAKTNLSELVKKAREGEEVILTSGREKKPVAKIVAIKPKQPQPLGFMYDPNFVWDESFWDPLPEEELRMWNGEASNELLEAPGKPSSTDKQD